MAIKHSAVQDAMVEQPELTRRYCMEQWLEDGGWHDVTVNMNSANGKIAEKILYCLLLRSKAIIYFAYGLQIGCSLLS